MDKEERYNYVFNQDDGDTFIYDLKEDKRIDDLNKCANILNKYEAKLAEKEKEIEDAKDVSRRLIRICGHSNCYYKNQTAIAELEKVKEFILNERKLLVFKYDDYNQGKNNGAYFIQKYIDQQIAELKGERK